ncbi:MAG TPA: hypothetical protein PKW95_24355, partial [bacterium]|nr:hypothetical protein [bacterium]
MYCLQALAPMRFCIVLSVGSAVNCGERRGTRATGVPGLKSLQYQEVMRQAAAFFRSSAERRYAKVEKRIIYK